MIFDVKLASSSVYQLHLNAVISLYNATLHYKKGGKITSRALGCKERAPVPSTDFQSHLASHSTARMR